jgi:hypothetical protein
VKGSVPRLFLVRVILMVVGNTAEDVKYIIAMMVRSVLAVVWH